MDGGSAGKVRDLHGEAAEALAGIPFKPSGGLCRALAGVLRSRLLEAGPRCLGMAAAAAEALAASACAAELARRQMDQAEDGIRHSIEDGDGGFLPGRDPRHAFIRRGWGLEEARDALAEDLLASWKDCLRTLSPLLGRLAPVVPSAKPFRSRCPEALADLAVRAAAALRELAGGEASVPGWDHGLPGIEELRGILAE